MMDNRYRHRHGPQSDWSRAFRTFLHHKEMGKGTGLGFRRCTESCKQSGGYDSREQRAWPRYGLWNLSFRSICRASKIRKSGATCADSGAASGGSETVLVVKMKRRRPANWCAIRWRQRGYTVLLAAEHG